jgi:glycosyltransferase involved in cell wall biosynthesis
MKHIKVLHIWSGNLYGGVESQLVTRTRERACCPEMELHFALCFEGRLSRELAALGTPATMLGAVRARYPWQVLLARRRLAALLAEQHFDVVNCHLTWVQAIFGPVVRRAGVPLVLWAHDAVSGKHWIERWEALCPPDLVVCNSHFTESTVANLRVALPLRCEVIYPPVSPPESMLDASQRLALRASLDTPSDACVIIQVGRMEPYKGHVPHLDALARLADTSGWVCWVVGGAQRPHEKAYLARLRRQATRAGIGLRVRFLGERHDIYQLLEAADIFCQPNLAPEPFGIVFIEALYTGLPVVSTAQGGALEIVDPSCGRLVAPNSPDMLADTLRILVLDRSLRVELGRNAPARAKMLCDPSRVLSQLAACFASLLPEDAALGASRR